LRATGTVNAPPTALAKTMNTTRFAGAALALASFALPASAQVFTIDFDGPGNSGIALAVPPPGESLPPGTDQTFGSAILGYYNGDVYDGVAYGRPGHQPWNTGFSPNAIAIRSEEAGGPGNFPTARSGSYAVGTIGATSFDFAVAPDRFITQLSFWYNADGSGVNPAVTVYSGGSSVFALGLDVPCSGGFCGWTKFEVPAASLAGQHVTRVQFSGTPNTLVFDDVFVKAVPVPEPATYGQMALGLFALAAVARRRRR
jgi:hypothetical protein